LFILLFEVILESDSLLVVSQNPLRVESGFDALVVAALLAVLLALGEDDAVAVWNNQNISKLFNNKSKYKFFLPFGHFSYYQKSILIIEILTKKY
jgi:hypothetical protein